MCEDERPNRQMRLRKVIEICSAFLKNLAYFRTGRNVHGGRLIGEPYLTFRNNCFEHAYLDWSKLFGNNRRERHHWRQVVTDQDHFEEGLLAALDCDGPAYRVFWDQMQEVRNRVVAHQDEYDEIPTPMLDKARQSVSYLLNYIYENEGGPEINLGNRYDPTAIYERFQQWGTTFWNGEDPIPEHRDLLTLRTVRLDENGA